MKKLLFVFIPVVLGFLAFITVTIVISQQDTGKGALQVTSLPQSNVYLNNKFIGQTPLCKCDGQNLLPTGDYTIRIVPVNTEFSNQPFEQKITISKSVLTVVDRTFGQGALSQGSIITLSPINSGTKSGAISITSFPSGVSISLDGNSLGESPLIQSQVIESDHDLVLSKPGYKDKTIRIHTVSGYMLSVIAFLGIDPNAITNSNATASSSASVSIPKATILTTPTGFLRVRKTPTVDGVEIGQVTPGQQYDVLAEQAGWVEIKLENGQEGWVSSQYVEKN